MSETLGRTYSLKSKIKIDAIFREKKNVKAYPLFLNYLITDLKEENLTFQLVFSAPKRRYKQAVQRNRIKRLMREVLRKNKMPLEDFLKSKKLQLALFLVYTGKEMPTYELLERKIVVLLSRLIEELSEQKN